MAVVALVALRLGLGCHFLYEGVWKIKHKDEFTAAPFLTQAKGPVSWVFYAMMEDINGRERLEAVVKAKADKKADAPAGANPFADRWKGILDDFVAYYAPADPDARQQFQRAMQSVYDEFHKKLNAYFDNNQEQILAHFQSLDRFENDKERYQNAPFQKQRRWDRMMELRRESDAWIADLDVLEKAYVNKLYAELGNSGDYGKEQLKTRGRMSGSWNPLRWSRIELINFAVTYSLTAIGVCLMLGFFTPLAALGGAGFMCFVVMTQPAWPTIYPPDPAVVGHALLVNKDFIEMLALLVVSATAAGRWGGLDFFLARMMAHCPICSRFCKSSEKTE
ncbi:MAG: DoxX family protein [Planctomycetaceae bacterium]|nr:DoxX family protein [Planctomycetaceae bacterium]